MENQKSWQNNWGHCFFVRIQRRLGYVQGKPFAFLDGGKGLAYVGSAMQLPTHFDNLERRLHGDRLHWHIGMLWEESWTKATLSMEFFQLLVYKGLLFYGLATCSRSWSLSHDSAFFVFPLKFFVSPIFFKQVALHAFYSLGVTPDFLGNLFGIHLPKLAPTRKAAVTALSKRWDSGIKTMVLRIDCSHSLSSWSARRPIVHPNSEVKQQKLGL